MERIVALMFLISGVAALAFGPLVTLRPTLLGPMLMAAGFPVDGPDLHRAFLGSLPQVEKVIADLVAKSAVAQSTIETLLQS